MKKETLELGEEVLAKRLKELQKLDVSKDEYRWTEESACNLFDKLTAAEKMLIEEENKKAERENEADRNAIEEADKAERRRIEEERNLVQADIEKSKQKVSIPKAIFEMMKIMGPVIASGIIFTRTHRENMEFEKTGNFCSSGGRSLNGNVLNRFLKF